MCFTLEKNNISNFIPPRSRLFNLEPIGIGTPYVESLTSYIARLAKKHNVTVFRLLNGVVVPLIKKKYITDEISHGKYRPKAINGNSEISIEFVNAFEKLNYRNDLIYLTMNGWSGIFPKNIVDDYRKWCPTCLNQWDLNNEEIYEPLIWYLSDVKKCFIHETTLVKECPNCKRKLKSIHSYLMMGYCQYCFEWLGNTENNNSKELLSEEEKFVLSNYQQLLEKAPIINSFPIKYSISFLFEKLMEDLQIKSKQGVSDLLGIKRYLVSDWMSNRHLPSSRNLIDIAKKLNTTVFEMLVNGNYKIKNDKVINKPPIKADRIKQDKIYDLLKDSINGSPKSLNQLSEEIGVFAASLERKYPQLTDQIKSNYANYQRKIKLKKEKKIQETLSEMLTMDTPISLSDFSRKYGISIWSIKRYAPTLADKLVSRYMEYRERLKRQRIERYSQEIKDIILVLHQKGIQPSKQNIAKELSDPNIFLDKVFRDIAKEKIGELGYEI